MNMFTKPLYEIESFKELINNIDNKKSPITLNGVSESSKCHIAYSVFDYIKRPVIIVTYNDLEAKKIYEDISFFTEKVCFIPSKELYLYSIDATSPDIKCERLKAIKRIITEDNIILITSIDNLLYKYISPNIFKNSNMSFKIGDIIDIKDVTSKLINYGYEKVDIIEGKGQFSIRGGIIDIFSMIFDLPIRIELFDDEIDSIRFFDLITQRSIEKTDEVQIFAARELILNKNDALFAINKIENEIELLIKSTKNSAIANNYREKSKHIIEKLNESVYFKGIEKYTSFLLDKNYTLIDFFNISPYIFIDEPSRIIQKIDMAHFEFKEIFEDLLQKGDALPSQGELLYTKDEVVYSIYKNSIICLKALASSSEYFTSLVSISINTVTMQSFNGKMDLLLDEIKRWKSKKNKIIILSGTSAKGQRLSQILREKNIDAYYYDSVPDNIEKGQIIVIQGILNCGFEYPDAGLKVISDKEIFGESKRKRKKLPSKGLSKIKSFTDLKIGDYVVHINHGIGIFQGVKQLEVEGIKKDYLDLRYASSDKLYVPVEQLDLVQKYIGGENRTPKVYKLGGTEWLKAKAKVKESIKKMAEDLVLLYAVREQAIGHAFSKDTEWQKQFEDEFPYEETPDQLTAIEEIKRDMENKTPMDRLLCGDVGYGKTEVAIRAAFKACMDGKQVAFLVPTTILAEQHYNNFIKRFSDFPVKIEMLSRFRTAQEQKRILSALKEGSIDILLGTHKLIQKDIKFKDLGLLIIDEEQRFGVAHKEKIKSLKQNIDVLTLSATPIPRTLHMSLLGVRDMSIIETPPEERYPVQTYVVEYNEQLIREAIYREINRGGQVYFVYNRVETIKEMFLKLGMLMPKARICIGHGQMSEHELENVMIGFLNGEYDVLLSTTIIESGLDIPNVNTLIVYDADKMGLSQLYQLRGRVGRSNRIAYAYFTYKKEKVLSEVAEKRLKAIREFTELGSGFKIAMRDLEIRGAGNILGPEQHGHMDAIGYDMYCRLIQEAVDELKGNQINKSIETTIELNINAYIDNIYISDENQKIEIYKKIASIKDKNDFYDVQEEIEDRFGDIPESLNNLLQIAYIKSIASFSGITNIIQKGEHINIYFDETTINIDNILKIVQKYNNKVLINSSKIPYLILKINDMKYIEILNLIKNIIEDFPSRADN